MNAGENERTPELRVVLDTNVIISAFCFPSSLPRRVFQAVGEHHILLFSVATMAEVEDVLLRDKFDAFLPLEQRIQALTELDIVASYVKVTSVVQDLPDPGDNAILALARDGRADYVVTGNTRDFMQPWLRERHAFRIRTVREFHDTVLHMV